MQRVKYLLTVNGKPAYFTGGQICYARTRYRGSGVKESEMLDSTRDVQRTIGKSIEYRKRHGWVKDEVDERKKYGCMPIRLGV